MFYVLRNPGGFIARAIVIMIALVFMLAFGGCDSDGDRIRETNEDIPTPTSLSAEIGVTEIQDGDCISSTISAGINIQTVEIVPCSGTWQFKVLNTFNVADSEHYPGEAFLDEQASEKCSRGTTFILFPTIESWALNDRTISCLQAAPEATPTPVPTDTPTPAPTATQTLTPTDTSMPAADRDALVALYEATGGVNWKNNANWLSKAPLGEWYGVITDLSGRVTELHLSENQLSGAIPAEVGGLTNLTGLDLRGNQLNGEIPAELGGLTNLRELYLWVNELSGEIPPELGSLANLQALYLSSNQLSGEIPAELGSLANLQTLFLSENQLSGEIPGELGGLANLQTLFLSENQLSGEIPGELGGLTNLTWLYLWGNQLSGEIPPELGGLTNLTVLYLWGNQLSGEIPGELGDLTNLTELQLADNRLSGCIPAELRDIEYDYDDLDTLGLPYCGAPEPTGTIADLNIYIGSDTVWKEVFDTLAAPEQSCIRDALDGELLESVLARPILEGDWEQWEVSIFVCLAPGTARSILLSDMVADIEENPEFSGEETSCLREWVAEVDLVALVAAGEDAAEVEELAGRMIVCIPDTFISLILAGLGLSMEDLGQEEASCLREWVIGADLAALVAAGEDSAEVEELTGRMIACIPDIFISIAIAEFGLSMEDLGQEEASCLREWVAGVDPATLVAAGEDAAEVEELTGRMIACIPDTFISLILAGLGLSMEDLGQEEASCLRELVIGADLAALVAAGEDSAEVEELTGRMIACIPDIFMPTGPQVVESPFGEMLVFEDPSGYFEVQVPADWEEETDLSEGRVYSALIPEEIGGISILVNEGVLVSLTELADSVESRWLGEGAEIITKETVQTAQDLPAVLLELSFEVDGHVGAISMLLYLSDSGTSVVIQYVFLADEFEAGKELAHYSFDTFLVN